MHALTGFLRLLRLYARIDRIKLPVVLLVIAGLLYSTVVSVVDVYGGSPQQEMQYAAAAAPSVVGRVFAGPIDGPSIGAIVLNEGYLFTALAVVFMSTLLVVRHTRQDEETGRGELIGSTVISKHAPLAAALGLAVIANVVFGALAAAILMAGDLDTAGSVYTGAAFALTGITFAALAGVAAQLTDTARGANGYCALIIGVAFLLRAIGDSTGRLVNGGTGVQSSFPSWLSPLGWGQQLYPFTQQRLWVFGLFAALIVAAVAVSLVLMTRRDVGMGIFPTKDGAPRAAASLSSAFGLARRLQGGVLRGWAVAVFILGVSYGLVINELQGFLTDNEELREVFLQFGDEPTEAFLGLLIAFMTITITGYAVQSMLRMRAEESAGHLEPLLATGVSRRRWVLSHVGFVALGVLLLTLLTALSMGVTYVVSTGTAWSELWDVFAAVFTQSAAIFAFMGFVMLLFGLLPNLAVPVAWGAFAGCFVVQQLGVLLDLPQWVFDLSPFAHLPAMPAEAFELAPLLALLAVAAALHLTGLAFFSRRDIQTK